MRKISSVLHQITNSIIYWIYGSKLMFFKEKCLYYINGPEVLPAPLSKKEEIKVFARLEQNDEKAKEILIVHNLRLVVYIAKKFESTGICVDDLTSIGTIGLIKAVNTFKPEKNKIGRASCRERV